MDCGILLFLRLMEHSIGIKSSTKFDRDPMNLAKSQSIGVTVDVFQLHLMCIHEVLNFSPRLSATPSTSVKTALWGLIMFTVRQKISRTKRNYRSLTLIWNKASFDENWTGKAFKNDWIASKRVFIFSNWMQKEAWERNFWPKCSPWI
jgi:hypothetical protein